MAATIDNRCIACGATLPSDSTRRRQAEVHHTSYCAACLERMRDGALPLVCRACRLAKSARDHFRRVHTSKTGYAYTCNDCYQRDLEEVAARRVDPGDRRGQRQAEDRQPVPRHWEAGDGSAQRMPRLGAGGTGGQEEAQYRRARQRQRRAVLREYWRGWHARLPIRAGRAGLRLTCRQCGVEQAAEGNFQPSKQARSGYVSVCQTCVVARAEAARAVTATLTCTGCGQTLPVAAHFAPHDWNRTGYQYQCSDCYLARELERWEVSSAPEAARVAAAEVAQPMEWGGLAPSDPAFRVRTLVGGHRWSGHPYPPDQRVYALVDPRDEAIYYVGHSGQPERRLQRHLWGGEGSNSDKAAWITELRDLGLRPQLVILEEVAVAETVREREDRWILHHLRRGEPLTNWQASFHHLAAAVRRSVLDFLAASLDDAGWMALVEAWEADLADR